jgi:hypothetical protein
MELNYLTQTIILYKEGFWQRTSNLIETLSGKFCFCSREKTFLILYQKIDFGRSKPKIFRNYLNKNLQEHRQAEWRQFFCFSTKGWLQYILAYVSWDGTSIFLALKQFFGYCKNGRDTINTSKLRRWKKVT